MQTVADINVILPILLAAHQHHSVAWNWWEGRDDRTVLLCWPVRLGTLRLLTNSRVMNGAPIPPEQALSAWDLLANDPRCLWSEPTPAHEIFFRKFVSGRASTPNLWTDAWLAAHAEALHCGMTSFDAGFRSFGCFAFEQLVP